MSTPFIEDSETTDVARRVLHRHIEWSLLETFHVSDLGTGTLFRFSSFRAHRRP